MGASEARNGRGSPGDQTLQKVRAVEVVHVDRFLDLDLVLGAVKMGPVTWRQDCVRTRIFWTVTLSIGSGWWVVSGLRICARNSNDRFKRKSGRCMDWGRGKEWAAGRARLWGWWRRGGEHAWVRSKGSRSASTTGGDVGTADLSEVEPGRRAHLHGKQRRFGAGFSVELQAWAV